MQLMAQCKIRATKSGNNKLNDLFLRCLVAQLFAHCGAKQQSQVEIVSFQFSMDNPNNPSLTQILGADGPTGPPGPNGPPGPTGDR